jgi:hypothetical protein
MNAHASQLVIRDCGLTLDRMFTRGLQTLDAAAKRWRRLVVHSVVSEDAAFDARRTAPAKPPPRFVDCRRSRRSQSAAREHASERRIAGGYTSSSVDANLRKDVTAFRMKRRPVRAERGAMAT